MPHILIKAGKAALREKWMFVVGTALIAGGWLAQNLLVDPKKEAFTKGQSDFDNLGTFETRLIIDRSHLDEIRALCRFVPDSIFARMEGEALGNYCADLAGTKLDLNDLEFPDEDSMKKAAQIYGGEDNEIESSLEKHDIADLQKMKIRGDSEYRKGNKQFQDDFLDRQHALEINIKRWQWATIFAIVFGAVFINLDKGHEYLSNHKPPPYPIPAPSTPPMPTSLAQSGGNRKGKRKNP